MAQIIIQEKKDDFELNIMKTFDGGFELEIRKDQEPVVTFSFDEKGEQEILAYLKQNYKQTIWK